MTLLFKKVGTYFSWYRYCLSHQFSYSWITKEQHTRDWNAVLFPLHPQLFERHNFSSFGVSGSVHNPVRTLAYSKTRVWSYCQKLLLAEGTGGGGEPPPHPSYSYKGGNRKNWPIERGKIYIKTIINFTLAHYQLYHSFSYIILSFSTYYKFW